MYTKEVQYTKFVENLNMFVLCTCRQVDEEHAIQFIEGLIENLGEENVGDFEIHTLH